MLVAGNCDLSNPSKGRFDDLFQESEKFRGVALGYLKHQFFLSFSFESIEKPMIKMLLDELLLFEESI
jgi:hypothetical protein